MPTGTSPQAPEFQLLDIITNLITNPAEHRKRLEELTAAKAAVDERIVKASEHENANAEMAKELTEREKAVAQRENHVARQERDIRQVRAMYDEKAAKWNDLRPQIEALLK